MDFSSRGRLVLLLALAVAVLAGLWWWMDRRGEPVPVPPNEPQSSQNVTVGGAVTLPTKTLYDNLKQSKDHTTFLAAMEVAGMTALLQSSQPLTVFAPSNIAFGKLPREALQNLFKPENKDKLKDLLNYHLVPGKYSTRDFKEGMKLKTVQGRDIVLTQKDGRWTVNGTSVLETADIVSTNAVAHSLDVALTTAVQP